MRDILIISVMHKNYEPPLAVAGVVLAQLIQRLVDLAALDMHTHAYIR